MQLAGVIPADLLEEKKKAFQLFSFSFLSQPQPCQKSHRTTEQNGLKINVSK